ncbi:hypothetical protein [Asticcacaulis sp. AND118]|uniref:hypothetical protein n=1 Tax=Asticcacaulis sp. AND118 TaxID=2840468 RepID=UPI001CFFD6C0|nr:hypothetical protein [Asticcacaulis sp. AND118]UDF04670.1 hypothetical protein LH365_06420 [Asticcacaulis sp. AND118]
MKSVVLSLAVLAATPALAAKPHVAERARKDYRALQQTAQTIKDPDIRKATVDALQPGTCVRHRAGLSDEGKAVILTRLAARGFVADTGPATTAGVFPPVAGEGGDCPTLIQPFVAAPGGPIHSHHGWPGGLPEHELFNQRSGAALSKLYSASAALPVDASLVSAAAIWHDWAKALVFQWQPDGTTLPEQRIGGANATGSHHVLGLSESMARKLSPRLVITQACAHTAPVGDGAAKVATWLEAAAIIARIDPIKAGYLRQGANGLEIDWGTDATGETGVWRECFIHNESDAGYIHSGAAEKTADAVLERLAPRFGYDPKASGYLMKYRHVVLAELGADRIQALISSGDEAALVKEIEALKAKGLL